MLPDEEERVERKLRARQPLTDDDHIAITRAWFRANPDPKFFAELRANLNRPAYRDALRTALNTQRAKIGRPFISEREFQRLIWVMQGATT